MALGAGRWGDGLGASMQHEISDIRNPSEGVGEDEDGVLLIEQGVGEEHHGAGEAAQIN